MRVYKSKAKDSISERLSPWINIINSTKIMKMWKLYRNKVKSMQFQTIHINCHSIKNKPSYLFPWKIITSMMFRSQLQTAKWFYFGKNKLQVYIFASRRKWIKSGKILKFSKELAFVPSWSIWSTIANKK